MNLEELRAYDWIPFYDCQTNIKEKKVGAKAGKYLAISGYGSKWKIYQVYGGLPVMDVWITSLADAVKIAGVIEKVYKEYLSIYEVWEEVDVIAIARLSVDGGEAVYNAITELNQRKTNISYADFYNPLMEKMK